MNKCKSNKIERSFYNSHSFLKLLSIHQQEILTGGSPTLSVPVIISSPICADCEGELEAQGRVILDADVNELSTIAS